MQPDENFWKKCEGERIANAYELEQLLGCGAFGGVFRAARIANGRKLEKRVAVKLMLSGTIQLEELTFALELPSHQNLVQHFAGNNVEIRGFPMFYLVMELADCSLADFVKQRGGKVSSAEAKAIVRDIAQGLKFLHELDSGNPQDKRYVHRDLKLLNVLQFGNVWKIADFGLAKVLDQETMQASKTVGTRSYMPPEMFGDGYVSTKWDVWSLGVMIVEMLTGGLPFNYPYSYELERQIQISAPNLDSVPSEWLDIVRNCLTKDHRQRCSVEDVLLALESLTSKSMTIAPDAIDLFNDGFEKYFKGDFQGAINDFNNAISRAPNYVRAYSGKGNVLQSLGHEEEAKRNWQIAISMSCNTADDYFGRGVAKRKLGDTKGSIADYNEAIRLKPSFVDAYEKLDVAESSLVDKQGRATKFYLNPKHARNHYNSIVKRIKTD